MKKWIFLLCGLWALCSCSSDKDPMEPNPIEGSVSKLKSFKFLAADNPLALTEDVEGLIVGDSVVECWAHYLMESKTLIPVFDFDGEVVTINDERAESGVTPIDFSTPSELKIDNKTYTVYMHAFTGLPVLWIDTENEQAINSKEEYVKAHFRLKEDVVTRAAGSYLEVDGQIRGRGNSTWTYYPKKPYRLKLDSKTSLLDMPEDKNWVLLANYSDKTLMRNDIALYLGNQSNLDYTPRNHFVEVILNGVYLGNYQLTEQIKISKNKVAVGDDGFLLEVDAKAASDEITFNVAHLSQPVNIKDPDVTVGDEDYNYVVDFVTKADEALFSEDFKNEDAGYPRYLDVESFVDWYLINEITKNNDAILYSSCYMHLKRGDKLKMGPLWDFDIAFGNVNYNGCDDPEGLWIYKASWFKRLFEDPEFVAKVKERFDYFYAQKEEIYRRMDENAAYLQYSIVENNNKWGVLYDSSRPDNDIWGNYQDEVATMKQWLDKRLEWLKQYYSEMN
jgi:hypothetical protein